MTWNTQEISVPAQYERLQKLLAEGEWEKANRETARVMLQVAGRKTEGYLDKYSFEKFPCEDLRTIDQLWIKYSNGRFSFSVQKNIWLECGGKVDYETECKLGDRIGWRVKKGWFSISKEWIEYKDINWNDAPFGYLPFLWDLWETYDWTGMNGYVMKDFERFCAFFAHIKSCEL